MTDPIPMRIPCPSCGALHIDEGEFETKPHHTHACQSCGNVWRPAIVATVGVRFLPGFRNESRSVSDPSHPSDDIDIGTIYQVAGSISDPPTDHFDPNGTNLGGLVPGVRVRRVKAFPCRFLNLNSNGNWMCVELYRGSDPFFVLRSRFMKVG